MPHGESLSAEAVGFIPQNGTNVCLGDSDSESLSAEAVGFIPQNGTNDRLGEDGDAAR